MGTWHMRESDNGENDSDVTRRNVMKGIGGLAALSMSNATIAEAEAAMSSSTPTDPHTRQTYRAIVDAVVPRTPELESELGPEHVPGGLDVELEKFIIWDFNNFQEIRLETLKTPVAKNASGDTGATPDLPVEPPAESPVDLPGLGRDLGSGTDTTDAASDDGPAGTSLGPPPAADDRPDALMDPDMFQVELVPDEAPTDLAALAELTDLDGVGQLGDALDGVDDIAGLAELLDFGPVDSFEVSFANTPIPADASGPAEFDVVVETGNDVVHRAMQNYPYAPTFPFVFDVAAAEFVLRGGNEDSLSRDPGKFAGGGTFVRLSREDRLRCLWSIVEGGAIDRLDALLSPLLPQLGILKYVVMAVNGLHGFGYYTEWSGYGGTKTENPTDRELAKAPDRVQSRKQTDYPGPEPGYAADWRHVIDGGFEDPNALDLSGDLEGDDVVLGGDGE